MNPKLRLFGALVLAGIFLLPPAAATGGDGNAPADPAVPGETPAPFGPTEGARLTPMYLADLENGAAGQLKGQGTVANGVRPENPNIIDPEYSPGAFAKGRGGRAAPDIYVAYRGLALEPPQSVRQWMGAGVYALKGSQTQINVTINNSGDGDASPVTMTAIIWDYFGKEVLNQVIDVGAIAAYTNTTAYIYWTPAYCTYWELNITLSTPGDSNPANDQVDVWNNGFAWLSVALWGDSCGSTTGWSGDIGANAWHITTTEPALDNASQHSSADSCWYHGNDLTKRYPPNQDVKGVSPNLDLRSFGKSWFLHFNYLFHGSMPALDSGDYFEQSFSRDNGATWDEPFANLNGAMLAGSGIDINWFNWYTDLDGNGQASGNEIGLEVSEVAGGQVKFRNRFVSNAANQDTGIYLDDFCVWGMEIQHDAGVAFSGDINLGKVGELKTFAAKVTNSRAAQPATFNCTINITKRGEPQNMLYNDRKTVNALGPGASQDITFSWTPVVKGDYVAVVNITGATDHDPYNNREVRWFHVSGSSPELLYVDDNPYGGAFDTNDMFIGNLTNPAVGGFTDYALYYTVYGSSRTGDDFGGDGPADTILKQYDVVVWVTGPDSKNKTVNGTLTANDQTNIRSYLNAGGALWLMSPGAINDLYPDSFTRDVLRVANAINDTTKKGGMYVDQHILPNPINGVPGSLADGASYFMAPPGGLNRSYDEADPIQPDEQAAGVRGVFYSDAEMGWYVALQFAGTYRLVFQTFDYSWLQLPEDRNDYIKRAVGFLTGGLEMRVMAAGATANHLMVDPGGTVEYTFTITNGGTKVRTLWDIGIQIPAQQASTWKATASPMVKNGDDPIDIRPMEELDIVVAVTAPEKALAGTVADINVSMTFQDYGRPLYNHTVTEVRAILGTEFLATTTTQNLTGPGAASYSFTLRNIGNLQVVAELLKSGDRSEWLTLGSPTVTLQPYEERLLSAVMTIPEGAYREAGHSTLRNTITSRVTYLGNVSTANLSLTTNIRVAQVYSVKIDDVNLDPGSGEVDMAAARPSVKLSVRVTAQAANGYDNVSVELKPLRFTPLGGSQKNWDTSGWTLPRTTVATTPFMISVKESSELSILVPAKAEAGDYTLEVRVIPGSNLVADGDTRTVVLRVSRPDFLFEGDISFNYREAELGTPVKIKVTVKNAGGVLARNVPVAFYTAGENLIDTKYITQLAPNGRENVDLTWEGLLEGDNEVTVRVDPDNLFAELNENNNELLDSVVGLISDLVFGPDMVFLKQGKSVTKVTEGDVVTIEVTVKNTGDHALNLTGVKVQLVDQKTSQSVGEQTVSIATRGEQKVQFTWIAKGTGSHTFAATVNPEGSSGPIKEKSHTNNNMTGELGVSAPPPETSPLLQGTMLYVIIAVVAIVVVVALLAVMMRRKPARPMPPPAEERVDVVEAETVEPEQK